jgi:protein-S-isoprenylcysteine O-methyltransferase Ste14
VSGLVVVLAALVLLVFVVIRVANEEYTRHGQLTQSTGLLGWALYALHGLTTVLVAIAGLGRVDLPAVAALAVGAVLAALGVALAVAGALALRALGPVLGSEPTRLVTEGPYRFLRHPQSVGWGLALLGAAVAGRSGLALALVAGYALAVAAYLPTEERHLRDRHGEAYERYRRRTPRILGRARA